MTSCLKFNFSKHNWKKTGLWMKVYVGSCNRAVGERPTKRLGATGVVPMRVAEEERVESGEGLGRKVLATESRDSTEGHL